LAREVCAGCKPLGPVFRSLSVTSPEVRAAVLQGKLPDAVAACGCAADLAALKALLWSMYGRPALIGAWFDIAPAPVDKEAVVSQPPDRPWHQAHRALLPLVKPGLSPRVRFAVEK
jgi:hypothetical protein